MTICIENYEAFFLDYVEGNLPEEEVHKLLHFLSEHPELREELEAFEVVRLPTDKAPSFKNKGALKKPEKIELPIITPQNCSAYFIACAEGQLNEKETRAMHEFLVRHPQLEHEAAAYRRVYLQADASVRYPDKEVLLPPSFTEQEAYLLAAAADGGLNPHEQTQLERLISTRPMAKVELEIYRRSRLKAPAVIFPDKARLHRKKRKGILLSLWNYGAAAAVVLLLLWWNGGDPGSPEDKTIRPLAESQRPPVATKPQTPFPLRLPQQEMPAWKIGGVLPDPSARQEELQQRSDLIPLRKKQLQPQIAQNDSATTTPPVSPVPDAPGLGGIAQNHPKPDSTGAPVFLPPEKKDPEGIAFQNPKDVLSPGEFIHTTVAQLLTGREKTAEEKVKVSDVAAMMVDQLDKVMDTRIAFESRKQANGNTWSFRIGSFSFSRSKPISN